MSGFSIRDLEANDDSFTLDSASWTASRLRTDITSICSGTYLLGGYGVLGAVNSQANDYLSRTYNDLPTHTTVYFSLTLWAIDLWEQHQDNIIIHVDSTTFTGWDSFDYSNFPTSYCGESALNDLTDVRIFGSSAHTASSLTFKVTSKLNSDSMTKSFGIRNINLIFSSNPTSTSDVMCGKASIPIGGSDECACSEGQYESSPGLCTSCDSSCASCFGPGSNECFECNTGYSFNGTDCFECYSTCSDCNGTAVNECLACKSGNILFRNNTCVSTSDCTSPLFQTGGGRFCESPCTNASEFLYWNMTCIGICEAPLQQATILDSLINACVYPCTSGEHLYWNGTCLPDCDSPFIQRHEGGKDFCDNPCNASQYLYSNGTCGDSCTSPFSQRTEGGMNYCDYLCTSSEHLYWNGTCIGSCDPPLTPRPEGSQKFCDYGCTASEYLYWNGTCAAGCSSPLSQRVEGGKNFCDYICNASEFLYWNGTCIAGCDPPLTQRTEGGKQFCDFGCTTSDYLYWNGTCSSGCSSPLSQRTEGGRKFCDYPCGNPEYLYWNSTCATECNSPLTQRTEGGKQFCDYGCTLTQFLYWNGTCGNCSPPLSQRTEGGRNFCDYPCSLSQFLYWNNSCISTCIPPLTLRVEVDKKFCDYSCSASQYLYWNGTCSASCSSPLVQSIEGGKNFCKYPCSGSEFLYWNGTCGTTCSLPLTQRTEGGKQFCDYGCANSEHLYWNGTCAGTCLSPLVPRIESGKNFCDYPCTISQILYWNGTCASSCDPPLTYRFDGGRKFCDFQCQGSQYLYWNGSCSTNCPAPLSQRLERGKSFCDYPCSASDYLYWDSVCEVSCDSPLIQRIEGGKKFCDYPCLSTEYVLMNGSCLTSCGYPLIQNKSHQITYCLLPCRNPLDYYSEETMTCNNYCPVTPNLEKEVYLSCPAHSTLALPIVRLLHYVRYIDTKIPLKFQRTPVSRGNNILSLRIHPGTLRILKKSFPNFSLPSVFQKPGQFSSFLANFLDDLLLLGILLCFAVFFKIGQALSSKLDLLTLQTIMRKLSILTRWNLPLILLATNIGDIIFFASLEFRTFSFDDSETIFSLSMSILILIIVIVFFVLTSFLVRNYEIAQSKGYKNPAYASFVSKWQNFQVLFGGYGGSSDLLDPLFFLIYCARQAIPMIIASSLYNFPLPQSILYILINISIISYIVIKKPIKKTIDFINLIVIEGVILLTNFSVLVLVILDSQNTENEQVQDIVDVLIIIGNYVITFQGLVFLTIKTVLIVKDARQLHKEKKIKERNSLMLQLLFIPFQQGAFCFEQTNMDEPPSAHKVAPYQQSNITNDMKDRRLSITTPSATIERSAIGFDNSSNRESPFTLRERKSPLQLSSQITEERIESEQFMITEAASAFGLKKSFSTSITPPLTSERDLRGESEASFGQERSPRIRRQKASQILSYISSGRTIVPFRSLESGQESPEASKNFYASRRKKIKDSILKSQIPEEQ